MPRDVSSADLPQEETSVEIVEEAAHRQSFKRAPPSRVSQKTMTAQFRFYGTAVTAFRNSWMCAALDTVWPGTIVGSVYDGSGFRSFV